MGTWYDVWPGRLIPGVFVLTLNYYKKALDKAYEDNIITKKEVDKLNKLKEIIISEGFEVAEEFKGISKDEMNILVALICKLKVPKSNEWVSFNYGKK